MSELAFCSLCSGVSFAPSDNIISPLSVRQ
jgi:hypothetical protein